MTLCWVDVSQNKQRSGHCGASADLDVLFVVVDWRLRADRTALF